LAAKLLCKHVAEPANRINNNKSLRLLCKHSTVRSSDISISAFAQRIA